MGKLLNSYKVFIFDFKCRLLERTEKYNDEDVASYNVYYSRLVKWMKETLRLRKLDIEFRRQKKRENTELIEAIKNENKVINWGFKILGNLGKKIT